MRDKKNDNLGSFEFTAGQPPVSEAMLRSEIGFWREMLSAATDSLPLESLERMRHALALAEHRLLQYYPGTAEGPPEPKTGRAGSSDSGSPSLE